MAKISLLDAFEESSKLSTQKAVDVIKAEKYVKGTLFHGIPVDPDFNDSNGNTIGQDLILTAQAGQNLYEACRDSFSSKFHTHNNYATLDSNGKIPASQLPGGLDEVIEIKIEWYTGSDGIERMDNITDVDGNSIPASNMKRDVLYVNVAEDKYANNIYRWSGTQLVLCPTAPKTENLTVEFEESDEARYNPDNIVSGSTISSLFATIRKAINSIKYIGSSFQSLSSAFSSHITNTTNHVKGVDTTPTMNSENVVTSHAIYVMGSEFNSRLAPIEYYIENPTELPFMEESEFISAINTALSEVE